MRRLHGDRESFEWAASEYLRMSGVYWGATAMALLGRLGEMDREGILDEVAACQVAGSGGFAASPGHDPHLLYTLSAVQLVLLLDAREDARVDLEVAVAYVRGLQVRVGGGLLDKTAAAARSDRHGADARGAAAAGRVLPGRPLGGGGHAVLILRPVLPRAPRPP